MNCWTKRQKRSGFSLLELVIVIVIMGIVAAVAIPRMSRGSAGASDAALSGNLSVLRNAIDMYAGEHNGTYPTAANIADQLTLYSSSTGATNATKTTTYVYGPYLRKVPKLPVGAKKGQSGIVDIIVYTFCLIYTAASGTIKSNTTATEKDSSDVAYNTY